MTAEETDSFLGRMETGVLSFAREGEPYAIPVSYGYDSDARTLYFRLVSKPDSTKRQFLTSTPSATFVVYEGTDDGSTYRSVVAIGELHRIDPSSLSVSQIEQYGDTRRPLFEIWSDDEDALDIELYQFTPERLTGRRTDVTWE